MYRVQGDRSHNTQSHKMTYGRTPENVGATHTYAHAPAGRTRKGSAGVKRTFLMFARCAQLACGSCLRLFQADGESSGICSLCVCLYRTNLSQTLQLRCYRCGEKVICRFATVWISYYGALVVLDLHRATSWLLACSSAPESRCPMSDPMSAPMSARCLARLAGELRVSVFCLWFRLGHPCGTS